MITQYHLTDYRNLNMSLGTAADGVSFKARHATLQRAQGDSDSTVDAAARGVTVRAAPRAAQSTDQHAVVLRHCSRTN
ncbi:MAG: hypothetical protein RIS44_1518 [Pseudomonadota bacterium]|jgi:hypothetical protein